LSDDAGWDRKERPSLSVLQGLRDMSGVNGVSRSGFPNTAAAMLAAGVVFLLVSCFDPVPAGEDLAVVRTAAEGGAGEKEADVPVPPEARHLLPGSVASGGSALSISEPAVVEVSGPIFTGNIGDDERTFCLLMLQDGIRFLSNARDYSVLFRKQERIGGDLSDVHVIDMKVREYPEFSVYMKWKNVDPGRQALYSATYEDGKLVVKLGGLKGRLLPAIHLDPHGTEAMAESRHPITEAGILFLAKRLIDDRRKELEQGISVKCTRLANTEVGERPCFQFQFDFPDAKSNPEYRKSVVAIDSQYHIPLQVQNWTWAAADFSGTDEELQEQTLLESYSFSGLNFGVKYAELEFSRENPKYRM
jgi:hypothetical protein